MAFSIWEYLRERARNATLAGIQDALDIAEDADFEASQKAAAGRLTTRLNGQDVKRLPEPERVTTGERAPEAGVSGPEDAQVTSPPAIRGRPFGEGLDASQAGREAPALRPAPAPAPDPFAERLAAPLTKPGPPRGPESLDRRGPARNGRPGGPAPALPESGPPPAAASESPERRKRGRPRKDPGS